MERHHFRSTKVRTFAHALITMPNSILAKRPITNWSRMGSAAFPSTCGCGIPPRDVLQRCLDRIRVVGQPRPGPSGYDFCQPRQVWREQFGNTGLLLHQDNCLGKMAGSQRVNPLRNHGNPGRRGRLSGPAFAPAFTSSRTKTRPARTGRPGFLCRGLFFLQGGQCFQEFHCLHVLGLISRACFSRCLAVAR